MSSYYSRPKVNGLCCGCVSGGGSYRDIEEEKKECSFKKLWPPLPKIKFVIQAENRPANSVSIFS